ncbi:MAG: T9SS type A sorting domain-containing protein, partial [Saprospiraceae bacterium]|nr:T9SS type A sorting domain-containing protein [Saprospiraceae bacterium]
LPVWSVRTLPYSVNYRLYDLAGSVCDTLGIDGPLSAPETLAGGGGVGLRVWPNPLAGEQLWVQVSEAEGGGAGVLTLSDAAGRLLLSQPVERGQGTLALPVGHLPAGLYLLTYRAPSGAVAVQKLVVPR